MSLTDLLRAEIAAHGPMPFHDFMARALYDPLHGYYTTGRARVGRKGDFFTSVSVGPLFGALLARQVAEVWEQLGRPEPFDLIEQGAHEGALAEDLLADLPKDCRVRLTIVEPAAYWQRAQEARLAGHEVRWVQRVEQLDPFTGVFYSNELIDAFPVHRVRQTADGWRELGVAWSGEAFDWVELNAPSEAVLANLPPQEFPLGYTTEVNPAAAAWMVEAAGRLSQGLILVIDYGLPRPDYYALHRTDGTLQAYVGHHTVPPLSTPGEADLTAHVDFTALHESARRAGLDLAWFTDQHHFLVALSRLYFADGVRPSARDMRAFQTLSHPTMLGRAFKVLGVGRGLPAPLTCFAFAKPDAI